MLLNAIADPAGQAAYTPPLVTCNVSTANPTTAMLQWQVIANKARADAGTALLCIYRDKDVWNRDTLTSISVPAVTVTVGDRVGNRTFQVDAEVQYIELR